MSSILYWLAGADRTLLERCPPSEQIKLGAIGASVLIPAVTGFGSMLFYVSRHTSSYFAIVPIALVWALIILTIDRLLLATYRPFSSSRKKTAQILLRVVLSFFLSTAVAHPICLQQFKGIIQRRHQLIIDNENSQRSNERDARIAKITQRYQPDIDRANEELDRLEKQGDPSSVQQETSRLLNDAVRNAVREPADLVAAKSRVEALTQQLSQINQDLTSDDAKIKDIDANIDREMSGASGHGASAKLARAEDLRNSLKAPFTSQYLAQRDKLQADIDKKSASKSKLESDLEKSQATETDLEAEYEKSLKGAEYDNRSVVQKKIAKETEERNAKIAELEARRASLSGSQDKEMRQVRELFHDNAVSDTPDPMEETLALAEAIKGSPFGWFQFVLTFGIFLLVDLIPILAKLMSSGPYDELVHRTEQELREEYEARSALSKAFAQRRILEDLGAQTREYLEHSHAQAGNGDDGDGRAPSNKPPPDVL